MKVKELIDHLKVLNQDAEIRVQTENGGLKVVATLDDVHITMKENVITLVAEKGK